VRELLAGGVTCINDMGTVHGTEVTATVLEAAGIRGVIGKALMDQGERVPPRLLEHSREALAGALRLADRFHGAANGRLRVSLAPRFILSCSEPLWRDVRSARASAAAFHTHVAEGPTEGREVGRWCTTRRRYSRRTAC
jgi:5-methylthioadenosine/S-adenosylhomocysteine deaminase